MIFQNVSKKLIVVFDQLKSEMSSNEVKVMEKVGLG